MIFFKPTVNSENECEIYIEAIENDETSGKCTLIIDGNRATVENISFDEGKPYLVEGILRSAYNYAGQKNCYMGYCKCENISRFLDRMNFIKENNVYYNDIPTILQGNCCKN